MSISGEIRSRVTAGADARNHEVFQHMMVYKDIIMPDAGCTEARFKMYDHRAKMVAYYDYLIGVTKHYDIPFLDELEELRFDVRHGLCGPGPVEDIAERMDMFIQMHRHGWEKYKRC